MITIAAYVLTLLAVFFSLTGLPALISGGLVGRAFGPLISGLMGYIVAWMLVDLLWIWLEGAQIPIAALAGAFVFILIHGAISKDELTEHSRWMMAAEAWALVVVGIYLVIVPAEIRWY